jgi:hypothetical protein
MDRHITVEFSINGLPVILHYRAERSAAEVFAAEIQRQGHASGVTVDDYVTEQMARLPCQRLFLP